MKVDFGLTADDYARHRAGFSDSFFSRLATRGVGRPGQTLVDLGTGTGTLARGFARRGCRAIGIDSSPAMLDAARRLAAGDGVSVEFRLARAEDTGLPDRLADVVCAGQCWHWFDRFAAAAEAARILSDAGTLVIAHFDWIPLPGNLADATEALIAQHNPEWTAGGGTGLYPRWLRDLGKCGYTGLETFSYDEDALYSPEAWRGRIRASAGVGGSLGDERVEAFDRELRVLLAGRFPGDPLAVLHRVFVVFAKAPHREG